jgi:hypothetical protein
MKKTLISTMLVGTALLGAGHALPAQPLSDLAEMCGAPVPSPKSRLTPRSETAPVEEDLACGVTSPSTAR